MINVSLIYADILKHWTACWQGAVLAGMLFMIAGSRINHTSEHHKRFLLLLFADGVFLYYLLYVTLFSRTIGSRREVEFLPFISFNILSGEFHYVIENMLIFIPFGFLLCVTLHAYGRNCNMGMILFAAFLTSISVELLQYAFSCGKSEADDAIANVAGAVIGYMIAKLKKRLTV